MIPSLSDQTKTKKTKKTPTKQKKSNAHKYRYQEPEKYLDLEKEGINQALMLLIYIALHASNSNHLRKMIEPLEREHSYQRK